MYRPKRWLKCPILGARQGQYQIRAKGADTKYYQLPAWPTKHLKPQIHTHCNSTHLKPQIHTHCNWTQEEPPAVPRATKHLSAPAHTAIATNWRCRNRSMQPEKCQYRSSPNQPVITFRAISLTKCTSPKRSNVQPTGPGHQPKPAHTH